MDRNVIFISKATPEDDEFVLWLAPRLEAAGYKVFADILALQPGDRWRKEITHVLQNLAIKMLLCCNDTTLEKNGVQEEIGIATDLSKELDDDRFIIPLRTKKYKKLFGIGELQYINFEASWAHGLSELLDALSNQNVPRNLNGVYINPEWENYRTRLAIEVNQTPEILISNWLRVINLPEKIIYYQPDGALDHNALENACKSFEFPAEIKRRGFFSFATSKDIDSHFESAGKFSQKATYSLEDFLDNGCDVTKLKGYDAKNMFSSMMQQAWGRYCQNSGLIEYDFSGRMAFIAGENHVDIGKKITWKEPPSRRSAMLRNLLKTRNKVWNYGVMAIPAFWPYPHFKLKAGVVFGEKSDSNTGLIIGDVMKQHKLRRSVCSGWRNKQGHSRLMAFLTLLRDDSDIIKLNLSSIDYIEIDANPVCFESPVSTLLVDDMNDDEENDYSTLGLMSMEDVNE